VKKLLTFLFVLFLSSSANGKGVINHDYVQLLFKHIHLSSDLKIPEKGTPNYPTIVFVPYEEVYKLVCPETMQCGAVAAAKWNVIMLSKYVDLDTPEGDSILYHELVHVAQWHTRGVAKTCKEWTDNEIQAYQLQHKYAQSKGHDMDWIYSWIQHIRKRCNY
jgi:hypothetical protein